jgi:hypothetical protein
MESVKTRLGDYITQEFAKQGLPPSFAKTKILKNLEEESEKHQRSYLDYLKDKNDVTEIYNLIRSKKHSKNQIRTKLKTFLKNEEDLNNFLQAILDSKGTKKEESKEAASTGGSSGVFIGPITGSEEKTNTKNVPTVRESTEKVETKEATSSGSSGQYSQPAIWAKSMSKKHWKGASTKYMPGAKRVQVKKKCKTFPYCNQGDINALKIFESEPVQNAIDSVSGSYGYNKDYISEIVFREIKKRQN